MYQVKPTLKDSVGIEKLSVGKNTEWKDFWHFPIGSIDVCSHVGEHFCKNPGKLSRSLKETHQLLQEIWLEKTWHTCSYCVCSRMFTIINGNVGKSQEWDATKHTHQQENGWTNCVFMKWNTPQQAKMDQSEMEESKWTKELWDVA